MTKPLTDEDKRAAFKARDEADRTARAELDAVTLDALIAQAEIAKAAVVAMEALCGDLVSDLSHHALKGQAAGGPSGQIGSILTVAAQSRAAITAALAPAKAD